MKLAGFPVSPQTFPNIANDMKFLVLVLLTIWPTNSLAELSLKAKISPDQWRREGMTTEVEYSYSEQNMTPDDPWDNQFKPRLLPDRSRRIAGYRGIWFDLGQQSEFGSKYSGGLGTYTAKHHPLAVHAPEVQKTFFVYGGTTARNERHLLAMASYYDHRSKTVPRPVVVHDKEGVDDPHDNPSLQIDQRGRLWVFVSGRGRKRPGQVYRSRLPHDISSFEDLGQREFTYPQPWWIEDEGFLFLFTKYTRGRELYWSTSDAFGESWGPDQKLAAMGGHYQMSNQQGDRIITAFNRHPGGNVDRRTNLYFFADQGSGQNLANRRRGSGENSPHQPAGPGSGARLSKGRAARLPQGPRVRCPRPPGASLSHQCKPPTGAGRRASHLDDGAVERRKVGLS